MLFVRRLRIYVEERKKERKKENDVRFDEKDFISFI